jgi:phosphoglycolate phosphatase-like HAD superfamily hydrolase
MRDVSTSLDMTEKKEKRLILFDIDSTLIASGGAGIAALKLASKKRLGSEEDLQGVEIAGRTDSGIVRQILAKHGIEPTEQEVRAFLDDYVELLARNCQSVRVTFCRESKSYSNGSSRNLISRSDFSPETSSAGHN